MKHLKKTEGHIGRNVNEYDNEDELNCSNILRDKNYLILTDYRGSCNPNKNSSSIYSLYFKLSEPPLFIQRMFFVASIALRSRKA